MAQALLNVAVAVATLVTVVVVVVVVVAVADMVVVSVSVNVCTLVVTGVIVLTMLVSKACHLRLDIAELTLIQKPSRSWSWRRQHYL